jgi:hypothetical protein
MNTITLLEQGQKEWQSDEHHFAKVVDFRIHYTTEVITFRQTSAIDEYNQLPIRLPKVEGFVRLQTDEGLILYQPGHFEVLFRPFVRVSCWERLAKD